MIDFGPLHLFGELIGENEVKNECNKVMTFSLVTFFHRPIVTLGGPINEEPTTYVD